MGKRIDRSHSSLCARAVTVALASALFLSLAPQAQAQSLGCTPDPSWASPDHAAATALLAAVNLHRTTNGLSPLEVSASLMRAAEWKAAYMAGPGEFSHNDPGRTWEQRIADCGYEHPASENIGFGYPTAAEMLTQWLLSGSHRANIENTQADATGIAAVRDSAGFVYWVQVFGNALDPDDAGTIPQDPGDDPSDPPDDDPPGDGDPDDPPDDDPTDPPGDGEANTAPVAVDDVRRVRPGQRVKVVVLANDEDADGDPLELVGIVEKPRRGRATFDPTDGTIRYRARRGTAGKRDRLTYRISDGNGGFDEGVVRFRIRR